jgi:SAM-dependent methyltransferase
MDPLIVLLLCELLLVIFGVYMIYNFLTQTPFYPSSVRELDKLIKEGQIKLPNVEKQLRFVDIGSGDGRFIIWAIRQGFLADGIEFNPFLFLFSRIKLILLGHGKNNKVYRKNFHKHKYTDYNIAYLFVFSKHMDKLRTKLESEMPKGSIIISNTFKFSDIKPDYSVGKFHVYTVK